MLKLPEREKRRNIEGQRRHDAVALVVFGSFLGGCSALALSFGLAGLFVAVPGAPISRLLATGDHLFLTVAVLEVALAALIGRKRRAMGVAFLIAALPIAFLSYVALSL